MTRTRYEVLMQRFRVMCVESGAFKRDVTNEELLSKVEGETHEDRIRSLEAVVGLVPEQYWASRGL